MTGELTLLIITAATIGFVHTILGPDHYLPFIMMAWSRKWSNTKTATITLLCGLGHIAGSILLGSVGIALGLTLNKLKIIESTRGDFAAWLLIAIGLAYLAWGLRRAYRNRPHAHKHAHDHNDEHTHTHSHHTDHAHVHDEKSKSLAPWALFIIFVFGPCEPLIPVLMYPAAKNSILALIAVTAVFGIVTIATMLATVMLSVAGVSFVPVKKLERFSHAIAGATILLCGLAIVFLGL